MWGEGGGWGEGGSMYVCCVYVCACVCVCVCVPPSHLLLRRRAKLLWLPGEGLVIPFLLIFPQRLHVAGSEGHGGLHAMLHLAVAQMLQQIAQDLFDGLFARNVRREETFRE